MNAIDEVQKQIDALQAQVDLLKQQSAEVGKKWEPVGGDWYIERSGNIRNIVTMKESQEFGVERATKEQAQRAAVEMRRFNRLLALRDELCGASAPDWSSENKQKWFLYYDHHAECWYCAWDGTLERMHPIFTSRQSAQRACDMLNSGDVEL